MYNWELCYGFQKVKVHFNKNIKNASRSLNQDWLKKNFLHKKWEAMKNRQK